MLKITLIAFMLMFIACVPPSPRYSTLVEGDTARKTEQKSDKSAGTPEKKTAAKSEGTFSGNQEMQGMASWYGPGFHRKTTANGEKFNKRKMTAAHKTLPFNTIVKVTSTETGKSVKVRINDRGPYAKGRIIDLSEKAAKKLGIKAQGHGPVTLRIVK